MIQIIICNFLKIKFTKEAEWENGGKLVEKC